jgi:histidinol-phosphate aminotransferase
MVHTREALAQLPAYTPGRTVPGAVKLASNEMPYPPLPSVAEAIAAVVAAGPNGGFNRYPDNAAVSLSEALAAHVGADPANIAVGCGSVALCQQLIQATCDDGDAVLFPWRSFEAYPIVTKVVGAVPTTVPVAADHRLDLGALAAAITDRTRMVFVCTPNNPTSTVVTGAELTAFLDAVPERVLVAVDEAYTEFVTDPDAARGLPEALSRPNVVSLRTLSKAYGLAGLRVGYAIGAPAVVEAIRKVGLPFAVNDLAQAAGHRGAVGSRRGRSSTRGSPRWCPSAGGCSRRCARSRIRGAGVAGQLRVAAAARARPGVRGTLRGERGDRPAVRRFHRRSARHHRLRHRE